MTIHGLDVSANNSHPINYRAVASAGAKFAFVKLTELSIHGEYVNPYKDEDISGFKSVGMDVGGYTFIHPDVPAKETVDFALAHSAGCYKIAVDSETNPTSWTNTSVQTHDCLNILGARGLLYSNPNYLNNMPGSPWAYPLWLAQYGPAEPSHSCLFWQYTPSSHWPGINGLCDVNLYYGDVAECHAFFTPPEKA